MGVNYDIFDVDIWDIRTFSISCVLVNKKDKMRSRICTVYGSAYEEKKQDFIDELQEIRMHKKPLLIGGDFNLVRSQKDKSNGVVDVKWFENYNDWIDKNSLIEIKLLGRGFTWSNNQEHVLMSHIDIVFCSIEFDSAYPFAIVRALPRAPSDHAPLLWEAKHGGRGERGRFKIEKWWMQQEEFKKLVRKV
jgi:exonuclease III